MPEPYYVTVVELRADPNVPDAPPPTDAELIAVIQDAEDAIDAALGSWLPDETSGRKIVEVDVDAWQWAKLKRATLKVAVRIYSDPTLLTRARYRREKGPDFEFEDPLGAAGASLDLGAIVLALLNDSGLRRLTGRANPGRTRGPRWDYAKFLNATRHDGT